MTMEKFHWTSPSGTQITLPRMDQVSAGILRRHRKENEIDFMFSLLEETSDTETLAKLDALSFADLNALSEKWQGTISVGESSGSST